METAARRKKTRKLRRAERRDDDVVEPENRVPARLCRRERESDGVLGRRRRALEVVSSGGGPSAGRTAAISGDNIGSSPGDGPWVVGGVAGCENVVKLHSVPDTLVAVSRVTQSG